MIPQPQTPARVLIYDASPGLGGAMTSLSALLPTLAEEGLEASVAAVQPEGWAQAGLAGRLQLLPARRHDRIHGAAYFQREAERALALSALLRRERPAVLLANNGPTNNLAAYLAALPLRIPVVQYVRGPFPATRLAGAVLRRASAVLAVGHEAAEAAEALTAEPATLVGEGLDPARWPRRRGPASAGLFWSSALLDWKGLPLLLEAHRQLGAAAPPLTACFARLPAGALDAADLPPAQPGVRLLESPSDLDALRAGHAVYVHSALRPEPFGRAVLEAMAAGLCPVVGDSGTPARLVRHGVNGLHYPTGSAAGLAEALRRLAGAPELARRLGDQAALDAQAYAAGLAFAPAVAALRRSIRSAPGRSSRSGTADHGAPGALAQ